MTRYELLDRIGVGGMAEIFRGKAVAAGGFEKPVAIKRILPHLSQDQRFVELLIAEAKVLSLLKHRNIVQIFDVGLGDDGKYFLVMEYVDGKDVGAIQRSLETQRRRVPYDLVLHIGAEICEALEVAHSSRGPDGRPMGLVHRDVSPSNVILSRSGEVKLTDFGIAKRAESEQTRGGAVRGKFAYISPEQARNEHLDPRSDVFSVGILLWELFVNRRLFSGLPDMEALRGVREANIPPPTQADSRLPKAIDAVVMQALSKDKARRFATAGELGTKLRQMRYALDVTVGDPATEIARIVEATIEAEKQSAKPVPAAVARDFDASEATVFRIRTDDRFSEHEGLQQARQVIDRFEDEETRLAQIDGDQLRVLRSNAPPTAAPTAPKRKRAPTDEPTRARPPLSADEIAAIADDEPNAHLTPTDATKLVVSRDRRTPVPQRVRPAGPAPNAPLTLDEPSQNGWKPVPTHESTNMLPHDPALDAPLTLEDSEPPSRSRSRSQSQSQSQSKSQRAKSVSQHSVSRSQSVSQSVSHSVSRSVPAPLTLEPSGVSPPQLPPAPIVNPIVPVAPQIPTPPPPIAPVPAQLPAAPQSRPSFSGWGPPIAAQIRPPTVQPVPQAAPARRPPTAPPPATTTMGGGLASLGFRPWMLIVGAVIVALAAFAITRAFIR